MKIAVLSPHRDDAAFSLGLSVEAWLAAGHKVHVLNCFTQSAYAPFSDAESLHRNDRTSFVSATRRREDLAWNKLLGGKLQMTDLDLLDAPLRLACEVTEVLTMPIRAGDRAVARVSGAIAKLARKEYAIALPLAIGGHIDHRVTREAGLDALAGVPRAIAFYEDLPYAARPHASSGIAASAEETGLALQPSFATAPFDSADAQVARKLRMAECYDTQIDSDDAASIASFSKEYSGRERLWANEMWRCSELAVEESAPVAHRMLSRT